jgi:hypothetical protein
LELFLSVIARDRAAGVGEVVRTLHKKHHELTFAPVEHTDGELHRRLKYVEYHMAPFFAVSLSEDQKNIVCTSVRTGKVRFTEPVDALWN